MNRNARERARSDYSHGVSLIDGWRAFRFENASELELRAYADAYSKAVLCRALDREGIDYVDPERGDA